MYVKFTDLTCFIQEQEALEHQARLLDQMRSDHEAFYQHTADLDESARARLQAEHERLAQVAQDVRQREKSLYQEYQSDLDKVLDKKKEAEKKVNFDSLLAARTIG